MQSVHISAPDTVQRLPDRPTVTEQACSQARRYMHRPCCKSAGSADRDTVRLESSTPTISLTEEMIDQS